MSIWTDPSEVIDLEFKVCWTGAGWLHVTAVIPSCRREVWPFSEAALHQTHQGQIDLDVQSRQLSLFCTFPNHTPFGFFTPSVWPSALPEGILLQFALACSPIFLSEQKVWTGLEQFGPEPLYAEEESCKMAPKRKSETCARLSVSGVGNNFRLRSVSGTSSTSCKHASMHEGTQGD